MLCSHFPYGCPWQGQLQHFEVGAFTSIFLYHTRYTYHTSFTKLSHLLQGHCEDCKYKPVRCPNPGCNELMPAEKIDSHVGTNCPFRKIVCNHCLEEIAASKLKVMKGINTPGATGVLLISLCSCSPYPYRIIWIGAPRFLFKPQIAAASVRLNISNLALEHHHSHVTSFKRNPQRWKAS